jgi:histidinol dehydrogenase
VWSRRHIGDTYRKNDYLKLTNYFTMNILLQGSLTNNAYLIERVQLDNVNLQDKVQAIFNQVISKGDEALKYFSEMYDDVALNELKVDQKTIADAYDEMDASLKDAILLAKHNIELFHKQQVRNPIEVETTPGVVCKTKSLPIARVGLYIPGGTAPLLSTILMLSIPAKIAGCSEIIICTPPGKNGIDKSILATAFICGVTNVYQVGGAQAIAAMAVGTQTIKKVSKIFGPGNQYVNKAKEMASQYGVAMDLPAGPSELLIYADETCVPSFVASDLLSQAEHGADSQVVTVVSSESLAEKINIEVMRQLASLARKEIASKALDHSYIIVEKNVEKAFEFINDYAPEHLIIASENDELLLNMVINAGSVFLGNYSPESAGDYASGTNHTLPTNGWAKSYSGLNVDAFMRQITIQKLSKDGIQNIGSAIIKMAETEQLQGHANAVKMRLNHLSNLNANV